MCVLLAAIASLSERVARTYTHLYMRHAQGVDFDRVRLWCNNEIIMALVHPLCNGGAAPSNVLVIDSVVAQLLKMHRAQEGARDFAKRMHLYDAAAEDTEARVATHFSSTSKYTAIVVPLHSETKAHWSLLVFARVGIGARWRAYHYDSLMPACHAVANSFVRRLASEMLTVDEEVHFENASTTHVTEISVPRQSDGWTCGYRVARALSLLLYACNGDVQRFHRLLETQPHLLDAASIARMLGAAAEVVSMWRSLICTAAACDNVINYEASALVNAARDKEQKRHILQTLRAKDENGIYS